MIQPVTIKVNQHQYALLQMQTKYWENWIFAHFRFQKGGSPPSEPAVAGMFHKYFEKNIEYFRFPKGGKTINLEYTEARAYMVVTTSTDDFPTQSIRDLIDKALTDWRPSFSRKSMAEWYNADEYMQKQFGKWHDLDEYDFEFINDIYNRQFPQ